MVVRHSSPTRLHSWHAMDITTPSWWEGGWDSGGGGAHPSTAFEPLPLGAGTILIPSSSSSLSTVWLMGVLVWWLAAGMTWLATSFMSSTEVSCGSRNCTLVSKGENYKILCLNLHVIYVQVSLIVLVFS